MAALWATFFPSQKGWQVVCLLAVVLGVVYLSKVLHTSMDAERRTTGSGDAQHVEELCQQVRTLLAQPVNVNPVLALLATNTGLAYIQTAFTLCPTHPANSVQIAELQRLRHRLLEIHDKNITAMNLALPQYPIPHRGPQGPPTLTNT